ncbi:MAG TPA: hypothetical protein VF544_06135 [Pyrinomonadaceae bacterium]
MAESASRSPAQTGTCPIIPAIAFSLDLAEDNFQEIGGQPKFMSSDADIVPTLQTIQESIKALAEEMRSGFQAIHQRLDRIEGRVSGIEHQLEQMDIRLDGIEAFANQTRSEVMYLRKEFKEFRAQFNQPA